MYRWLVSRVCASKNGRGEMACLIGKFTNCNGLDGFSHQRNMGAKSDNRVCSATFWPQCVETKAANYVVNLLYSINRRCGSMLTSGRTS